MHRRTILSLSGCLTAALWAGAALAQTAQPPLVSEPAKKAAEKPDPNRPLWLRYPAVSPDGKQIAFTYGGQIWVVPATGGRAHPLTNSLFYSYRPIWSPDGKRIAFASSRNGNFDVFIMPVEGGATRRLTYHSSNDTPYSFSADGKRVYYSSVRLGDPKISFYNGRAGLSEQLYAVPVTGGRERLIIPTPALDVQPSRDGRWMLYTNHPAYEQQWRKHAISDATRDIWVFDGETGRHRQLTRFRGEDRNPMWSPDGRTIYYLSERSGSFNVWRRPFPGRGRPVQVTRHKTHPVRFLTVASDGSMVYSYDGEIWRLAPGAKEPARVKISITRGTLLSGRYHVQLNRQATEITVSPNGRELAIVVRGDVFVVSALSGTTRRITNTPEQERSVSFGPRGRTLLYASERKGKWDIYATRIVRKQDRYFFSATLLKEQRVIHTDGADSFQPVFSPRGPYIAYLENRTTLKIYNLRSKKAITVLPGDKGYSYSDGDIAFSWSPDGRWLVARIGSAVSNPEIALIDASGRKPPVNLTQSGYYDILPTFTSDGRAVVWASDRRGLRSATNNPAEFDIYATFLNKEAFDRFRLSPEQFLLHRSRLRRQPKTKQLGTKAPAFQPQLTGLRHRTVRLTPFSVRPYFFKLTPDNERLILIAWQGGTGVVGYMVFPRTRRVRQIFTRLPAVRGAFATDRRVQNLYFFGRNGIIRYDLRQLRMRRVPFNAEVAYDLRGERRYIFNHVWRLTRTKFYDPKLHGVDWEMYGRAYARFLPHIHKWRDFAEMLSEMVGELNASHTGAGFRPSRRRGDQTASLGLYYDHGHDGEGMKIADVLAGGPADRVGSALRPGAVILTVDGEKITSDMDIYRLLNRKRGRRILLTVRPAGGGKAVDEVVTPTSFRTELQLAYERWVDRRRALTGKLSKGRVGYIHIANMKLRDFQRAFSETFGQFADKEAIVIDVRFNGGGNLHDQLISMATGRSHARFVTRDGVVMGVSPDNRWSKPSAVLANAASYSDGMIFPYLYQAGRIGPVIGERVPGTGTFVWWERQQERRLVYGVPQLGIKGRNGRWLENQEVVPNMLVYNDPNSLAKGRDRQLEVAVRYLLRRLGPPKKSR